MKAAKTWKDWSGVRRGKGVSAQSLKQGDTLVGMRTCIIGNHTSMRRVWQTTDGLTYIHHNRGFKVYGTLFQGVFTG